jgi:hypothetical protein
MDITQALGLLLALSAALNVAFAAGIVARLAQPSTAQAVLIAAGAAGTALVIILTALPYILH